MSAHVRAVAIGDQTVLLDLRRDKYFCVSTAGFARVLEGRDEGRENALYEALVRDGVVAISNADDELPPASRPPILASGPTGLAFLYSCRWAQRLIRARRLDMALDALASAKHGCVKPAKALARFADWRPWYPARNVCLFDSLALSRFLQCAGVRFELAFGVRLAPFAAHCWVEAEGVVLNDEEAYCRSFTEILRSGQ